MAEMRKCPFCGKEIDDGYPYLHFNMQMGKWIFDHWCDLVNPTSDCGITIYGKTKQEVIDKWNGVHHE